MPARDGNVTRIVCGPDRQVLEMGREQRLFPRQLRRALDVRDKGCVFRRLPCPHLVVRRLPFGRPQGPAASLRVVEVHHGFRIELPAADGAPTAPTAPRS